MKSAATSGYGLPCSLVGEGEATIATAVDNMTNQVCRVTSNASCRRGHDLSLFTERKDRAVGGLIVHGASFSFSIHTAIVNYTGQRELTGKIPWGGKSSFTSTDYL